MAATEEIRISDDIEFRVIANIFGLMIASAGLLAGEMMYQHSFDYWMQDSVPIFFAIWMAYRLFKNFLSLMIAY